MNKKQAETELIKTLRLIADCDPPFHSTTKDWDVWDWQRARQQHIEIAREAVQTYVNDVWGDVALIHGEINNPKPQ